jgi:hypothetical protein
MSYDQAKTALDVAIANEIKILKENGQLSQYLQNNQAAILDDLFMTKDNNMRKVYGDLGRAVDTQKNTYYYYQRNKDMLNLGDIPLKRLTKDAQDAMYDNHNAQRQFEINQWSSGNRMDTLFGFQIIFVAVTLLAIFTGLWRTGFISTGFLSFLTTVLIVIVIMTFVIRIQYTSYRRNKRFWNKRDFGKYPGITPEVSCPTASELLNNLSPDNLRSYYDNAVSRVQSGTRGALSTIGDLANQGAAAL